MRTVNGIELDDGVDEPEAYDWHDAPSLCAKGHGWLNLDGSCSACLRNANPPAYDTEAPNNRPQDGRICDCEDAPCCGHYEL